MQTCCGSQDVEMVRPSSAQHLQESRPASGIYYGAIESFYNDYENPPWDNTADNWRDALNTLFPRLSNEFERSTSFTLDLAQDSEIRTSRSHCENRSFLDYRPLCSPDVISVTLHTEHFDAEGHTWSQEATHDAFVLERSSENGSLLVSKLAVPLRGCVQQHIVQEFQPALKLQLVLAHLILKVHDESILDNSSMASLSSSTSELCRYSEYASTTSSTSSHHASTGSAAKADEPPYKKCTGHDTACSDGSGWEGTLLASGRLSDAGARSKNTSCSMSLCNSSRGAADAVAAFREFKAETQKRTWSLLLCVRKPDGSGKYGMRNTPLNGVTEYVTKSRHRIRNRRSSAQGQYQVIADVLLNEQDLPEDHTAGWSEASVSSSRFSETLSSIVSSEDFDAFMQEASRAHPESFTGWQKINSFPNERRYYLLHCGPPPQDNPLLEIQKLRGLSRSFHAVSQQFGYNVCMPEHGNELSSEALCNELAVDRFLGIAARC